MIPIITDTIRVCVPSDMINIDTNMTVSKTSVAVAFHSVHVRPFSSLFFFATFVNVTLDGVQFIFVRSVPVVVSFAFRPFLRCSSSQTNPTTSDRILLLVVVISSVHAELPSHSTPLHVQSPTNLAAPLCHFATQYEHCTSTIRLPLD